jgi:microfibrillar-associated protein 1
VRKREYGEATLEDRFDKSAMPKVMQVKKFGFSGQTK